MAHITVVCVSYSSSALDCQCQSNNLKVIQCTTLIHTYSLFCTHITVYVYIICLHKSACVCIHFKGTVQKFKLSNCRRSCRTAKFHFISCHTNNNEAATYWHLLKYLSQLIYIHTHTQSHSYICVYACIVGQTRNVAVKNENHVKVLFERLALMECTRKLLLSIIKLESVLKEHNSRINY